MSDVRIVGAAQSPYTRHPPRERDGEELRTETVLADAVVRVLEQADFHRDDVDGLGVSAFTLGPDHAIDLAWRLGMRLRWLMEDTNGGACGPNLLQHAVRAIEGGDAELIAMSLFGNLIKSQRNGAACARLNLRATGTPAPFGAARGRSRAPRLARVSKGARA
jgi:acetyl-CoA acetyltransferase